MRSRSPFTLKNRETIRRAFDDPAVAHCWSAWVDSVEDCWTLPSFALHDRESLETWSWTCYQELLCALQQQAKPVVMLFGPFLLNYLFTCAHYAITGRIPPWTVRKTWQLTAGNPLARLADGTILHGDLAHPHHFEEFAEWKRSLFPQRKPGPKKFSGEFPSREHFLDWLKRLVRAYYEEKGRAPSIRELATFTEYSRKTVKAYPKKIYRHCRTFAVDYDEVVREIFTEMSRPESSQR